MHAWRRVILLSIMAAAAALAGGAANAQSKLQAQLEERLNAAVSKVQDACAEDVKKYCSMVTPGEGRLILCMQAHEDKVSSKCDYALFDASLRLERALDRLDRAAEACWDDIEKFCANTPEGGGRIVECLAAKKTSLSRGCQAQVNSLSSQK